MRSGVILMAVTSIHVSSFIFRFTIIISSTADQTMHLYVKVVAAMCVSVTVESRYTATINCSGLANLAPQHLVDHALQLTPMSTSSSSTWRVPAKPAPGWSSSSSERQQYRQEESKDVLNAFLSRDSRNKFISMFTCRRFIR